MGFKGERSYIGCFVHVLNLIGDGILALLGSSDIKEANAILDAAVKKNKKNPAPGAAGAKLHLDSLVDCKESSTHSSLGWNRVESSEL